VVENRVLRETFGPKTEEVTREWRNLHNENLYYLYSPYIIQVMKSKATKCSFGGHEIHRREGHTGIW
jgi:hypothetical protein